MKSILIFLLAIASVCGGGAAVKESAPPHVSSYKINGRVVGTGTSRGEAYADAQSRLPVGATIRGRSIFGGHTSWTVILYWSK